MRGRAWYLLRDARARATKRGQPCTITREWIEERLLVGLCEATGRKLVLDPRSRGVKNAHPLSPSLDRIDPLKGYTPDNTMLVCWKHNTAKAESTFASHLRYCEALLRHQGVIK